MKTTLLNSDDKGIETAVQILSEGGLVAFPTETVYGLGADALNSNAVERLFEVKKRPKSNPAIVHLGHPSSGATYCKYNDVARKLIFRFWPGPLTIVLPTLGNTVFPMLSEVNLGTLALRVPSNGTARNLLERFGGPVLAPSANLSGKVSPTTARHVLEDLDGKIDAVIDDGPCSLGLESTVVLVRDSKTTVLRHGAIPKEEIEAMLESEIEKIDLAGQLLSPGQLASHYAPNSLVRMNAGQCKNGEVRLGFGNEPIEMDMNLSPTGNLEEAGRNLYSMLRTLDVTAAEGGNHTIAVSSVPETGLGAAINDRLRRASQKRK